jgi:hypothetical protein
LLELELEQEQLTPYENFLFALKAKETKIQYPHRLDKFLDFMGLKGTIEEKCTQLYEFSKKSNVNVIQSYIIKFINYQKTGIVLNLHKMVDAAQKQFTDTLRQLYREAQKESRDESIILKLKADLMHHRRI